MAKVHTPEPGNERPGAAGALASALLNEGTAERPEGSPFRTLAHAWMETAAGPEALAYCRWRQERAHGNEPLAPGRTDHLLDFLAILDCRSILASYGRVYGLPTDDILAAT